MRFVHTADLHLGRRLAQMSLESDMEVVLSQLEAVISDSASDALVVSGDVFDSTNPNEATVRLWDRFVSRMADAGTRVLVVSGAHDSGARLSLGADLMARSGIHVRGSLAGPIEPVVVDDVNVWLLPYLRPSDVRAWAKEEGISCEGITSYDTALRLVCDRIRAHTAYPMRPNVCVTHQVVAVAGTAPLRSDSEQLALGTNETIDASAYQGFDYVALGHLHAPQCVGRETLRYAGSPLKLSGSEAAQEKAFLVVDVTGDAGAATVEVTPRAVEPARDLRVERGTLAELVARAREEDEARRGDFVEAVVCDDDATDVVASLRDVWPNLVQVSFDNALTKGVERTADEAEVDLETDVCDLFRAFFASSARRPLNKVEEQVVANALERASAEGDETR